MARGKFTETIIYDGKRYEVTASSKERLQEKVFQKRMLLESGLKSNKITVKEWYEEWVEKYKKNNVCEEYYKDIKRIYKNQIDPIIGKMSLADVKPVNIQEIANSLEKYSTYYQHQIFCILREILFAAVDNKLISSNPASQIELRTSKSSSHRRSVTDIERQYILKTCEKHWGGLFVKIMLYCGLRPGEVSALKWEDVDLKKKLLFVSKALKSDDYIGKPKTNAGVRSIIIPDQFVKELKVLKKDKKPDDLVCLSYRGLPMRANNTQRMWESFIKAMHVEMGGKLKDGKPDPFLLVANDLTLYCLRHTYCTNLQSAGVPINIAKSFMGHANIHTTADIYTHTHEDNIKDAKQLYDKLQNKACGLVVD